MSNLTKLHGSYWIGAPGRKNKGNETAYFKHIFKLDKVGKFELSISAHSRYRLWINGEPVTSGPCKGDRWYHYYETIDISNYIKIGENIIAAKVVAYAPYESQTENESGPMSVISNAAGPCLIAKGQCIDSEGSIIAEIATGVSKWETYIDNALEWKLDRKTFWMGSMEVVHGERLPDGWKTKLNHSDGWSEADRKWQADAYEYGVVPVFPLAERTIPLLYERKRYFLKEMPVKGDTFSFNENIESCSAVIPPCSKKIIEMDAGELTTGYINLHMDGGKNSSITIKYAECYSMPGNVKGIRDDYENYSFIGHGDVYYPSGGSDTYEPFWFRTFRFVRVEIETGEEALTVYPPFYLETGYPLDVNSSVKSSQSWIEPLWDISIRTLKRCMHETYEDCPYFEQLQYTMDTRLEMLYTYMASGDTRLALKAIDNYHSSLLPDGILQSRTPSKEAQVIPAFALHWIFMLEDYYWQTGDISVPRRYRPTVDAVLDWYDRKIGTMGLVEDLGYWEFIDWVDQWDDLHGSPRAVLHGPSSIHNMVYVYALKTAARLSNLTGRLGVAEEYEARALSIMKALDENCWNAEEGMYREGPGFEEYSQQAQVWAVLCGLAVGEKAKRVLEKALTTPGLAVCSLPMSFYMFRALEQSGMYDKTDKLWARWKNFLNYHLTTCPEINDNSRSDCHAWSSLALYEFTRNFLGVNPLTPGWEKIRIEKKASYIDNIVGQVITPKGMVNVEWKAEDGKLHLKAHIPEGIYTEVVLPFGETKVFGTGGTINI